MTEDSYSGQIFWAVVFIVLGLIFFVVWLIIYINRVTNDIPVEWWSWMFLGFGLFFLLIGMIWLIVSLYSRAHTMQYKGMGYGQLGNDIGNLNISEVKKEIK